jgi:hypothetical protein
MKFVNPEGFTSVGALEDALRPQNMRRVVVEADAGDGLKVQRKRKGFITGSTISCGPAPFLGVGRGGP